MLDESIGELEQRVLVVAPTTRDGEVTLDLLAKAGLKGVICSDLARLCHEIQAGAGAVLLTAEALASRGNGDLAACLHGQPSWSDLPFILLMKGGYQSTRFNGLLQSLGNVTLLERPAPSRSVVSAVQTAVRARQRQYQIRDYISAIISAERERDETRQQLLKAERAARTEAERVSRIKDEFLATLSHELRTPLNAIFGWTQILKMDSGNPATIQEGIKVIDRNVRLQTQLIEDLLDTSRIISGKVRLDVQRIDLAELIRDAIDSIRPDADARELLLVKVIDPLAGQVNGDPGRLQQVLWNLMTNAVKFTPKGGMIRIVLERVGSDVEVSVIDSGVGISPEYLPYLFERFSQADASTTRKHGGLGLGLSIVNNLIELHGGTIRAKSAGAGLGSTFTIKLPIPMTEAVKEESPPPRTRVPAPPSDYRGVLSGLKVLVVDDEPDARELVNRFLIECGATAAMAASAAEAQTLLDAFRPDVIICDIGMPDQDGYEFIRAVRGNGHTTPAVALTAFARDEDRIRSLQAGFQTHLPKPVEPTDLIAVVASLTGRF